MGAEFSKARAAIISREIASCPEESTKVSRHCDPTEETTHMNKIADSVKNCRRERSPRYLS
jgi:hypothetical protein